MARRKTTAEPQPDLSHIAESLRPLAVPLASIVTDPANVRTHGEKNLQAIRTSLQKFGQRKPIVVNRANGKAIIEAGNGTYEAAKALGWTHLAAVEVHEDAVSAASYAIADNRTGELAEWDEDGLGSLLQSLRAEDVDLGELGFDEDDLAGLLEDAGEPQEAPEAEMDRAEELNQKWGVNRGDVWEIGGHRLMCGDSTSPEDVGVLMGESFASLVVTDPPYGVSYADKNKFLNSISRGNQIQEPIANDHGTPEENQTLWKSAFREMNAVMKPGAVVYCFMPQGGDQMMMMMMMMMMGAGIEPRHELIWLKNNHVLGRVDYAYKHEPILYAWKSGGHKFYGDFQTSILEFPKPQKSDMHPTMKPVPLIARLIENSSLSGEAIYDPFLGSGTTIVAAEQLSRRCYGMEISENYCAVILERMAAMGLDANRLSLRTMV